MMPYFWTSLLGPREDKEEWRGRRMPVRPYVPTWLNDSTLGASLTMQGGLMTENERWRPLFVFTVGI